MFKKNHCNDATTEESELFEQSLDAESRRVLGDVEMILCELPLLLLLLLLLLRTKNRS